jgi:L-amino acid N-acyltransferase YncA
MPAPRPDLIPAIRVASAQDAEAIAGIYAPAVTESATSFELTPPSAAEMRRRISTVLEKYPWLVVESSGEVLGYVYATTHRDRPAYRWSVDTAVYIRSDAHRRGIGRALYTALLEILALQGFRNAYAGTTLPNPSSVALHEAMGFKQVGTYRQVGYKMGKWHDVAWFERQLAERVLDPPEPIPFPALATPGAANSAIARAEKLLR